MDDIVKTIKGEKDHKVYKINRDILCIDYWKNKIFERYYNLISFTN